VLDYEPKIKSFEPNDINKENNGIIGIEKKISGKITIKNIFFEYPKENTNEIVTVLKNITLDIYPGMKLGIVGFSGSGKTTLINLIQRLYDVGFCERTTDFKILRKIEKEKDDEEENEKEENEEKNKNTKTNKKVKTKKINQNKTKDENCEILIDDVDIKKYNLKCLHSQIGYVPQEPSLFDGTIRENLIYGLSEEENISLNNKDKYDKEIQWSLNISQANFVFDESKFPLGLETIVGSKGTKLSGGQKQRIAIARALIKRPKILILDEATSALDSESEAVFQKELFNLKGKMTIIIVSHRLCTIKDCDEIVVINEGKIVEKGKHEELIACRGIYHSLMEKQIENE
jgi:ATP-binding cassette subfamily B (MDR/TAP) protein 1